jgi:hypothetical protein
MSIEPASRLCPAPRARRGRPARSRHCGLPCPTRCRLSGVGHAGPVALAAAPGHLVKADRHQTPQALLGQLVGDHALDDPPTVFQSIRSRRAIGVLAICWARKATTSSSSRVWRAPGRAKGTASTLTLRSPGHLTCRSSASMKAALPAQVEVAPAALPAHGAPRPAGRSGRRLAAAAKADSHHHSPALERAPVTDASGVGSARTPTHPNLSGQRSDPRRPRDLPDRRRALPKSPLERQLAPARVPPMARPQGRSCRLHAGQRANQAPGDRRGWE